MSKYQLFDASRVQLFPIQQRVSRVFLQDLIQPVEDIHFHPSLPSPMWSLACAIRSANRLGKPVIFFIGGHVIKEGLAPVITDLMRRRIVTHVACNGAGLVHDWELATVGETSEHVGPNIQTGTFGMWEELQELSLLASAAHRSDCGYGELVGQRLVDKYKHPTAYSIFKTGSCYDVPVTVHCTVGADVYHGHPCMPGASLGGASYNDFLIFVNSIAGLEDGGVFVNIGSAVLGPEVYLKALSMVRNVAHQDGQVVKNFTTAVFDIVPLPENWADGEADAADPAYYYRPWKTVLLRTVRDGGTSHYVQLPHQESLPLLWQSLNYLEGDGP